MPYAAVNLRGDRIVEAQLKQVINVTQRAFTPGIRYQSAGDFGLWRLKCLSEIHFSKDSTY
jgi:hypothetical protein